MQVFNIMEVCGTHTMAIAKAGIKKLLPENIKLISGPGCPVCVTPASVIDAYLKLSERKDIIITSYGDMLKVPGSRRGDNLSARKALGADVRIVFSPMDALDIAEQNPEREVVFLGAGFETTAPGTAACIGEAVRRGLKNFSVLAMMRTIEPAIRTLYRDSDFNVSAFLCPGHVATILGAKAFEFIPQELGLPAVISGFDGEDVILSVSKIMAQIKEGKPRLENEYERAVSYEGNQLAMDMINRYLCPEDAEWRGLGIIPSSGLGIRAEFAEFDASKKFNLKYEQGQEVPGCSCGEIICGKKRPNDCPLFGKLCTPEDPVGPCMVSSEGACAAAYKYGDF